MMYAHIWLLRRQSNAALQLSQLETERLMAWLAGAFRGLRSVDSEVEDELKQWKKKAKSAAELTKPSGFMTF